MNGLSGCQKIPQEVARSHKQELMDGKHTNLPPSPSAPKQWRRLVVKRSKTMTINIEQIIEKFRRLSKGGIPEDTEADIEDLLLTSLHSIREETVREAVACVPKEEVAQYGRENSWEMEHANGFNTCRTQTLSALKALIVKE